MGHLRCGLVADVSSLRSEGERGMPEQVSDGFSPDRFQVVRERLASLLADVGFPTFEDAADVELKGHDPYYRSRFAFGEASAVALAACGAAAASVWRDAGGRRQVVGVDVREAAAGLNSYLTLDILDRPNEQVPVPGPDLLAVPARCADGRWIQMNGSLDHLRDGSLRVLACGYGAEEIEAAVGRWPSDALETALAEAGVPGAVFRTPDEWGEHPQGAVLRGRPLVEVARLGDAPAQTGHADVAPLAGLRVLDMTRVLAGPSSSRLLAAFGADVMHIASPRQSEQPVCVVDTGHGKLSAYLDLDRPEDAERLRSLVRESDVFVQNVRLPSLERRGFGAEAMRALRPGLIYVTINCYGIGGPWAERPGYEPHADAATGIATARDPFDRPCDFIVPVSDYTTGALAALGVLGAVARRRESGGSYHVTVSLARTAMWIQSFGDALDQEPLSEIGSIEEFLVTSETPFGRLRHFRPTVRMTETPTSWARPPVPLGSHPARWPG